MRPIRLELSGFASYREPATLDFTDVDLFVLSGPTGSGKSSLIDALTFCLYGSVPRYDDKRLVAPVISQGQLEARVRLDFSVDERTYTAVRVVRRTKTGATTKEARLERDGRTLAGSADELTSAVEALLGLTFEHFTRTVVLPQGDFQEFLHAKPKDRQDLLVQLLDLDVYRRVASAARSDEAVAKGELEGLSSRLEGELAEATDDNVEAARREAADLTRLVEDLDQARPELDELIDRGRAARQAATEAAARRDAVTAIEPPEGLDALATRLRQAAAAVTEAEEAATGAEAAFERAREQRADRPATAAVQRVLDATTARERADARAAKLAPAVQEAQAQADTAEQRRAGAEAALQEAEAALEELRRQHRAHTLAEGLSAGDPCPVCERELDAAPDVPAPEGAEDAATALDTARRELQRREAAARQAAEALASARADAEAAMRAVDERRDELTRARGDLDLPTTTGELTALVTELEAADRELAAAEAAARQAREEVSRATRAVRALDDERAAAFRELERARDTVAALEPPSMDRDDLGASWQALLGWRDRRLPELTDAAAEADRAIGEAIEEHRKRIGELRDRASEAGIEIPPAPEGVDAFAHVRDTCVAAASQATQRAEHLASLRDQATEVRQRIDGTQRRAELSKALGQHLNAKRFEKWLLNRALGRLVSGASEVLRELSSGAYSLALGDDNNFLVIDHRNADEQRSARTLSGGETFLASLSLALSLAEDVAALAAHGSARLDALFLDEGFGTLDADTLDVVAAAIEELGSHGRMVGLITHVRELSERVPVRYEVRKGPGGSRVERVSA